MIYVVAAIAVEFAAIIVVLVIGWLRDYRPRHRVGPPTTKGTQ